MARGREAVGLHALGEALVLLVEHLTLLLAHGFSQNVCSGERVAGHLLRDAHDLLLVDDQAVGLGEDLPQRLFQLRVDRLDRLAVVLAVGVVVVGVHAHRAGPVQRDDRDDVLELRSAACGAAGRASARRRAGTRPACHRGRAVRRWRGSSSGTRLEVELDSPVGLDVLECVADDRQVAQAEEVHLQQADGLARRIVPAGDDRAVLRPLPQRDGFGQRLAAHDHRAGVHAGVADQAFQAAGGFVDGAHVGVGVDEAANLGGLLVPLVVGVGDAGQRNVLGHDRRRQRLGDPVGDRETRLAVVDAGRILQRRFGFDGAEGDDLSDPVTRPTCRRRSAPSRRGGDRRSRCRYRASTRARDSGTARTADRARSGRCR